MEKIFDSQRQFQELAEVKINSNVHAERIRLAEIFLFKAVEEIIELRRTFPSQLNKWSKTQPAINMEATQGELCDVLLYLINFCLAMDINPTDLLNKLKEVQANNFNVLKSKKMALLNNEILRSPSDPRPGIGNLTPIIIYLTQKDGLPENFYKETEYVTKLVKDSGPMMHSTILGYWSSFLIRELEILFTNNSNCLILISKEEVELNNLFEDILIKKETDYSVRDLIHFVEYKILDDKLWEKNTL